MAGNVLISLRRSCDPVIVPKRSFYGDLKMNRLIQLGLTAAAFALLATSANAAVTLDGSTAFDAALATGQTTVVNFDSPNAAGYTFAGSTAGLIYNGADGEHVNIAAPPFGDTSLYMALQTDQVATLNTPLLKSLSLYIGSLDPTNSITFKGLGGFSQTFLGADLFDPATGDQTSGDNNRRFFFSFNPTDQVNQIVFTSGENSLEFDNIGALASAVPEPATWAMMLLGFGGIGFMLRNSKRRELGLKATA